MALEEANDAIAQLLLDASRIKWRRVFRDLLSLRFLERILIPGKSLRRPRPAFEDLKSLRIAIYFAVGGFVFDSIKPMLWGDWRPPQYYGSAIFYLECNAESLLIAAYLRRLRVSFHFKCILLGASLFISGFLNFLFVGVAIGEFALATLVWHGAFGFFAGLLLGFSSTVDEIRRTWTSVGVRAEKDADVLVVRKELVKELQWSITVLAQSMATFVAIFGVTMTLFVTSKVRSKSWDQTDVDFKSTAIQLCAGLAICVIAFSWWGFIRGLDSLRWVKERWLH